ncbi:MAG: hypothetical protein HY514_01295 [Candidatus Aenigmarchaeota archaeon]|nr:hypothetical protein [Candidatus Aenigmarchaeota archaeon]
MEEIKVMVEFYMSKPYSDKQERLMKTIIELYQDKKPRTQLDIAYELVKGYPEITLQEVIEYVGACITKGTLTIDPSSDWGATAYILRQDAPDIRKGGTQ